jgi:ribonucleoside-diphosphate reductase alpha chain
MKLAKIVSYAPQGFALDIFKKRYTFHSEETWNEACDRVAQHMSSCESEPKEYQAKFNEILTKNLFMPGGRIWYGSGRPKGQLLNCFVTDIPSDSREGWGEAVKEMIVITGTGGGLGTNFSTVRPRNTVIQGTGGKATGAVSLMEIENAAGEVIKAGGGRRTALMFCLNLNHGDIIEFLDKKLDLDKLNNANVSVVLNDNPEDFFTKVKNDEVLQLVFNGKVVGEARAKDLWNKIIANALKTGEPGMLNGYLANKMSNIYYYATLNSTNPCGEIWLEDGSCCCLGAVVLPRFIQSGGNLDWHALSYVVQLAVRFLDNVLTVNQYPLPRIKEVCQQSRRIGLGIMGLHDMLLLMGLKYNSHEGLEFVDKVMNFIKNTAYEASINLASEKGSFPKLDVDKYLKSGFAKTLKPSIRSRIKEVGVRNCALLTIAPTGTTSIVCEVSSGIESMFAPAYLRKYRDGDNLAEEVVLHPLFKKFMEDGMDVSHFQGSYDLSMRDHFEMQRVCQKHLDNACSKTINIPQGTSHEELSDLYMEFLPELKGVTVYPEGSRENQPLTPIPLEQAKKHFFSEYSVAADGMDNCKDGKCDI